MPFDPSAISEISSMVPSVTQAKGAAYKLQDLIDQEQLDRLAATKEKGAQADVAKAKQVLSRQDISTPQGATRAAQELTKAGLPGQAMDMLRVSQQQQSAGLQSQIQQYELAGKQNDVIAEAIDPIMQQLNRLKEAGLDPAMLDAKAQQLALPAIQKMAREHPDIVPHLREFLMEPQALTYNGLKDAEAVTKRGSELLKSRLDEMRVSSEVKARESTELHQREQERLADVKQKFAEQKSQNAVFTPEVLTSMAEQYLSGDKSVFQNLGRGTQGAQNIVNLRNEVQRLASERGMDGASIAAKIAEFGGLQAGERALRTRSANIEMAVNEAYNMIPVAREANHAVNRGSFKPWNQLVKGGNVITNDPEYARFAAATLAVVNTWARAISPSGVPAVADKEHANQVLNTVQSAEAYDAVLDQFMTEMQAARKSPSQVREEFREGVTGKPGEPGPGDLQGLTFQGTPVTEDDIQETMKQSGMTREQVIQRLRGGR